MMTTLEHLAQVALSIDLTTEHLDLERQQLRRLISRARDAGSTYEVIGEVIGVSSQRVHQITTEVSK